MKNSRIIIIFFYHFLANVFFYIIQHCVMILCSCSLKTCKLVPCDIISLHLLAFIYLIIYALVYRQNTLGYAGLTYLVQVSPCPRVLELMVNNLCTRNHAIYVGTQSKEWMWIGGASMICNCKKSAHVKTIQVNNMINVKSVLNAMWMICKCGVIPWKYFCKCQMILWNVLRLFYDYMIIIHIV